MWALRILNGPQAGLIYILKPGKNLVGRQPGCDLQLNSAGISKQHLEISVTGNTILIKDLKSSNGTFLNGLRVQGGAIKFGDKISLNQTILDVIKAPAQLATSRNQGSLIQFDPANYNQPASQPMQQPMVISNQAPMQGEMQTSAQNPAAPAPGFQFADLQKRFDQYLHQVFLPGIYRLVEVFQFRSVMMGFAMVFIFMVTLLSIFPMNQITSESIKTESKRRALTVARALANSNERAIRNGDIASYSADLVLRDEGISHVYIISKDGTIMAPPESVGMTAKDIAGFVQKIKGQTREMSDLVTSDKIAASSPILVFDPEVQQNVARAHAVVVYDVGSLKFDDGRALGLFVQMLAMALILGAGLFFIMYKLIEYPFIRVNEEIDAALREGRDHTQIDIKLPLLQQTLVSVNSLLARSQQGGGASAAALASTRDNEWENMLQLFGYPALLLSKEMQILSINPAFEALTGAQRHLVQGQALAYLPDQALQKNISELANSAHNNTQMLHSDKLEISGHMFQIQCQAITVAGEARYYLIGISPIEAAEGGAA